MIPGHRPEFSVQHPPPTERFEDARRIDVRPRGTAPKPEKPNEPVGEETEGSGGTLLHFSCPACLHMLSAAKTETATTVKCPTCNASVMPPQLVNVGLPAAGKTTLPPPKKSGFNEMKR